jgi:hypothetical protein
MRDYGIPNQTMRRKSYGKIYVAKQEDIEKVKEIIKEMDQYEYDYLPNDLIGVFEGHDGSTSLTYTHKFDGLNMNELMVKCWNQGIHVFYIN